MNNLTHLSAARVLSLFKIQADNLQGAASEAATAVARIDQEIAEATEQDRAEREQLAKVEQTAAALRARITERVDRLEMLQGQRQEAQRKATERLADAIAADAFITREYGRLRSEQPATGQAPAAQDGGTER